MGPDPDFGAPWSPFAHVMVGTLALLFWLTLIGLVAWAVIQLAKRPTQRDERVGAPSAMELLRERYVLGEIDATTFEEMLERMIASEAWERSGARYLRERRSSERPLRQLPG